MNKREFLQKLREFLSYELPENMVRDNVNFYSDYINSEEAKGRRTAEILEELGDPQLIARSIIDAAKSGADGIPGSGDDVDFSETMYGNQSPGDGSGGGGQAGRAGGTEAYTESGEPAGDSGYQRGGAHSNNFGCLTYVLIFIIVIVVFSLFGNILGFLSPVIVPVIMVCLILWLFKRTGSGRKG